MRLLLLLSTLLPLTTAFPPALLFGVPEGHPGPALWTLLAVVVGTWVVIIEALSLPWPSSTDGRGRVRRLITLSIALPIFGVFAVTLTQQQSSIGAGLVATGLLLSAVGRKRLQSQAGPRTLALRFLGHALLGYAALVSLLDEVIWQALFPALAMAALALGSDLLLISSRSGAIPPPPKPTYRLVMTLSAVASGFLPLVGQLPGIFLLALAFAIPAASLSNRREALPSHSIPPSSIVVRHLLFCLSLPLVLVLMAFFLSAQTGAVHPTL